MPLEERNAYTVDVACGGIMKCRDRAEEIRCETTTWAESGRDDMLDTNRYSEQMPTAGGTVPLVSAIRDTVLHRP